MEEILEKLETLRQEAEYMSDAALTDEEMNMYSGRESAFNECIALLTTTD
jgi:hypothetical protein